MVVWAAPSAEIAISAEIAVVLREAAAALHVNAAGQ